MEQPTHHANGHIRELSEEQAWELFDKAARYYLDISGDEFLERWDSGYYEDPDQPEIMSVVVLLPFARSE